MHDLLRVVGSVILQVFLNSLIHQAQSLSSTSFEHSRKFSMPREVVLDPLCIAGLHNDDAIYKMGCYRMSPPSEVLGIGLV